MVVAEFESQHRNRHAMTLMHVYFSGTSIIMFLEFSDLMLSERAKYGLLIWWSILLMQGLDLSVIHIFMFLVQCSISVSKAVDVGSSPIGHIFISNKLALLSEILYYYFEVKKYGKWKYCCRRLV